MINEFVSNLTISRAVLLLLLIASSHDIEAKEAASQTAGQQPLGQLEKVLKQTNGIKMDAIMDQKLASNVTNALNEMALNLRKMFVENRRLTSQVQDVLQRLQNTTGVNATSTFNTIQQQAANPAVINNITNLSSMASRFANN